jgi:orotate phosphoribosyltransferase
MKNQVEGDLTTGRSVVVVEDLVSTGSSSLNAVHALRDAGCEVKGMVSIFTYGFDESVKSFETEKVKLHSLTNYQVLLDQAMHDGYITEKDLLNLNEWRKDPSNWGKQVASAQ